MKINWVAVAHIIGTVMSIGATLLTGWAGEKSTQRMVTTEVAKALKKSK